MITSLIALAILAAQDAPQPSRVSLRGGDHLTCEVVSIAPDGVICLKGELVGEVRAELRDVARIELSAQRAASALDVAKEAEAAAARMSQSLGNTQDKLTRNVFVSEDARLQRICLTDGSAISGRLVSVGNDEIELSDTFAGKLTISRDDVRAIVFSGVYSPDLELRLDPGFLRLRNGDELSADIVMMADGKVFITAFFGDASVGTGIIAFAALGEPEDAPETRQDANRAETVLGNGDVLLGKVASMDAEHLTLQTSWAKEVKVPRGSIAWVSFPRESE